MARPSELAMTVAEVYEQQAVLKKVVDRLKTAGAENIGATTVEAVITLSRGEYRTLKAILLATEGSLAYWDKRLKRGR